MRRRLDVHLRLVVQHELAVLQRLAQLVLQRERRRGALGHRLRVEHEGLAPVLAPPQRGLGVLQQRLGVGAVVRVERDAGLGRGAQLAAVQRERLAEALVRQRLHPAARLRAPLHRPQQHGELVRADARDLGAAGRAREPPGRLHEQRVARRAAERFVDGAKALEVHQRDGKFPARLRRGAQRLVQVLEEPRAVGKARQRVVARQDVDLALPLLELGDGLAQRTESVGLDRRQAHDLAERLPVEPALVQEIVGAALQRRVAEHLLLLGGQHHHQAVGRLEQAVQRVEAVGIRQVQVGDDQVIRAADAADAAAPGELLQRRAQRGRPLHGRRRRDGGEIALDDLGRRRHVLEQQDADARVRRAALDRRGRPHAG